jgi:hypothetical protein
MPNIRIDPEVYSYLQARGRPFVDTPNDVLRRLFQLDEGETKRPTATHTAPGGQRMTRGTSGLDDPKRYLPSRVVTITGPDGVRIESGVRNDRGADFNQVQTDMARLVGSRNPATSRALNNLREGSLSERVGEYTLTVTDRA